MMIPILFSVSFFGQKRMIYSLEWEFFLPIDTKNKLAMTCVFFAVDSLVKPWNILWEFLPFWSKARGSRRICSSNATVVRWHDAVELESSLRSKKLALMVFHPCFLQQKSLGEQNFKWAERTMDHGCDYLNFPRPIPASAEIDLF